MESVVQVCWGLGHQVQQYSGPSGGSNELSMPILGGWWAYTTPVLVNPGGLILGPPHGLLVIQ